jgi:undecaprenyl-diphosphatase
MFGWTGIAGGRELAKAFDTVLHLGTLIGAATYLRQDIHSYASAWWMSLRRRRIDTAQERIAWALAIGTIPSALVGVTLEGTIVDRLANPIIASALAVFGVALWWVNRTMPDPRELSTMTVKTGLLLGLAQALALQPGVSRSGVTVMAARSVGFDRSSATRFSFLLALPIIAGAELYEATGLSGSGLQGSGPQFLAGFITSTIAGFLPSRGCSATSPGTITPCSCGTAS